MESTGKRPERRHAPRKRARIQTRFWNKDGEGRGYTSDISGGGLFVETRRHFDRGTRLHVELTLKDGPFFIETVVARNVTPPVEVTPVIRSGLGLRVVGLAEVAKSLVEESKEAASIPKLEVNLQDRERLRKAFEHEINRGGLFVQTNLELARDQEVLLQISLPEPCKGIFEARAVVLQMLEGPVRGAGLKLLDLDQVRGKIQEILQTT